MSNIQLLKVRTSNQLDIVLDIRKKVFIHEQNISPEEEFAKDNYLFTHFLLLYNNEPVATARIRKVDNHYTIGRVAVLKQYRKLKIGSFLMQELHKHLTQYTNKVVVHAQLSVAQFYESLGYNRYGEIFLDANIPHIYMEKIL